MFTEKLNDKVVQNLGLLTQPFKVPEECDELFHNTSYDMLINSLIQQLTNNDLTQLVIGERYIGKSCFCRRLLCEIPPELVITYYHAKRKPGINDLFATVLGNPDKLADIKDTRILAAEAAKRVFNILSKNQQPVFLIDNAHLLTPPVLRMLFRFLDAIRKQNRGSLKIILVGERKLEQLWRTLDQAAPADETIYTSLLRPLNFQDLSKYLTFRFRLAGASKQPFTNKQLRNIQQKSGGLPGKIENIACNILNGSHSGIYKWVSVTAVVIVIAVTVVSALFTPNIMQTFKIYTADEVELNTASLKKQDPVNQMPHSPTAGPLATTNNGQTEQAIAGDPVASAITENRATESATNSIEPAITSNALRDSIWLKQWPENFYVIQLIGSWEKEGVIQVAQSAQLEKDLIFHTSLRNGRVWYVLLYGVFPDRQTARKAIRQLPAELQSNQPWPRPISTLN